MSVTRLVSHENPEARATPLLLLAALRDIDPTTELVYFGERDWRVGAVRNGEARDFRAKKGDQMLDALDRARAIGHKPSPKSFMLAHLLKQGFAQVAQYEDHGDPSGVVTCKTGDHDSDYETTILEDFRQRDWWYRKDQGEAKLLEAAALSAGDPQQIEANAKMTDYLHTDGRDHYARTMRGRIQSGVGGVTGSKIHLPPQRKIITGEEVLDDIRQIMAELGGEVPL